MVWHLLNYTIGSLRYWITSMVGRINQRITPATSVKRRSTVQACFLANKGVVPSEEYGYAAGIKYRAPYV